MGAAMRRLAKLAVALAVGAATASAYYPFLHYPSRNGPFVPIPEKFDLSALPSKTLHVYVSEVGPVQMAPGDSFTALVSQIRLAAQVWNEVDTSELRVAFGGLFTPGTPQSVPRIEVLFDDVPGVLAVGGPTSWLDPVSGPNGLFVPIARSVLILNRDLTQQGQRPSFGEAFFLTLVHEMGHALGLQHVLTSSAMSTELTRATTRATPLANDDEAGLSVLYPAPKFAVQSGSISGQVTLGGLGLHMASVVALMADRTAFSALTNPDGTYRIDGLPAGQYYIYVHPLPPAQPTDLGPAGIRLPQDLEHRAIPAGDPFDLQFYPGVRDPQQAFLVPVAVATNTAGINFLVQRRGAAQLHSVTTYSFPSSLAVKPAFLNPSGTRTLVAIASSPATLTSGGVPAPGLSVSVLGGGVTVQQIRAYPPASQYLQVDFALPSGAQGPRHLVFSLNSEVYVLPAAFYVVNSPPPFISFVTPLLDSTGSRAAIISGANLAPDTRILFDGLLAARTADFVPGGIVVNPPPGAANYQAAVTALNSDGQSSLFLQAPLFYTYEPAEAPAIALSQNSLPAGAEAMLEIAGVNTSFSDAHTRVGFGSSDVFVRRVWVMSPTRLRVQVSVSPSAQAVPSLVSVINGFQVASLPFGFQVSLPNPRLAVVNPQLVNPATGQNPYPGSLATVSVSNLSMPAFSSSLSLALNDVPVAVAAVVQGQITFTVPPGFPPGPAVLRVQNGADLIYPVLVQIDPAPPIIMGVLSGASYVDPAHPVRPGDFLIVTVSGLAEPGSQVAVGRVRVIVAGIDHQALAIAPAGMPPNAHQVLFSLSTSVPAGQQTLTVTIDGRSSWPFPLPVRGL
jgi:uncharacterized protein (TIGR03437 family)